MVGTFLTIVSNKGPKGACPLYVDMCSPVKAMLSDGVCPQPVLPGIQLGAKVGAGFVRSSASNVWHIHLTTLGHSSFGTNEISETARFHLLLVRPSRQKGKLVRLMNLPTLSIRLSHGSRVPKLDNGQHGARKRN